MPIAVGEQRQRASRRSLVGWATSPLSLLRGACTVILAIVLGLFGAGGTYALWNVSATLPGATIVAGTAALLVPPTVSLPATPLTPGGSTFVSFTVVNSGNVSLGLQLQALVGPTPSAFSQSLTIGVGVVASAGQCSAGTFVPTWSGTFASATPGSIGTTPLASAGSALVCLSVTLNPTAPNGAQGLSASFGLTIAGVQP